MGIWFVEHRVLAFVLMIGMMFSQYVLGYDIQWVSTITNRYSMDFIPIYPWFWVILFGIVVAPLLKNLSILSNIHCPQFLRWLGKHSLKIYLFHQPILFGSIFALKELKILQSSPL